MKESITPERIANAIAMLKNDDKVFSFILEGSLDCKIYPEFFQKEKIHIQCSWGYEKLLKSIDILKERGKGNVLGIIDRDFRDITNEIIDIHNVFLTDYHDLETMIINSNSLDQMINICIKNKDKVKDILSGYSLKEYIFHTASIIACLRYLNYTKNDEFGLRFDDLNYKKMIDSSEEKIINLVIDCSKRTNENFILSNKAEVIRQYEIIKQIDFNKLQFVNGHDLMNLLFHSINLILKKESSDIKFSSIATIESTLLMSYISSRDFYKTHMLKEIHCFLSQNNYDEIIRTSLLN